MEYARDEWGIYKILNKYERDRGENNLCVQLGNLKTNEFCGESYESDLEIANNLLDLLHKNDYVNNERIIQVDICYNQVTKETQYTFKVSNGNVYKSKLNEIESFLLKEEFRRNCIDLSELNLK